MRIPLNFTGPAYTGRSGSINAQEAVNLIHVVDNASGKSLLSMIGRPCLEDFSTIGASPIRGSIVVGDFLYTVSYDKFYRVANNGVETSLGTLDTNTGIVGMAFNGSEIMIVDGTSGYIWNVSGETFNKIVDAGFSGGNDVTFIDQFFVVNNPGTGVAQSSGARDGVNWSALDKATAEGDPDSLVKPVALHNDLLLMGESTVEPWYYASLPHGFPFLSRQGRIQFGLAARWGAVIADNSLYWLAQNKEGLIGIVRATGGVPQKISSPAIDYQIGQYSGVNDCVAWTATIEGHTFIGFTFSTGGATWVYDSSVAAKIGNENAWTQWKSSGLNYFKAAFHAYFNGNHILGDLTTGKLYKLKFGIYKDGSDTVQRTRTTAYVHKNNLDITYDRLVIDFEVGVGLATGQGSDPQAMLQFSDDGGRTWSNELWRSIGKVGEFRHQAIWTQLGTARSRIFKLTVSDPVKLVIIGAYVDVEISED